MQDAVEHTSPPKYTPDPPTNILISAQHSNVSSP